MFTALVADVDVSIDAQRPAGTQGPKVGRGDPEEADALTEHIDRVGRHARV
jgi:hypothetical protein